jgi:hypothetical protein
MKISCFLAPIVKSFAFSKATSGRFIVKNTLVLSLN